MTATVNGVDWLRVIERADAKLARRSGDDPLPRSHIEEFAQAVQAQLGKTSSEDVIDALNADRQRLAASLDEALVQRDTARAIVDRLKDRVAELEQERATAGEEYARLSSENVELADRVEVQRQELDAVLVERDQLRVDLEEAKRAPKTAAKPKPAPHRHVYAWPDPESLPRPCECGHPYPRALSDVPEDGEAGHDLQSWDLLMEELRVELEAAGFPAAAGDEP